MEASIDIPWKQAQADLYRQFNWISVCFFCEQALRISLSAVAQRQRITLVKEDRAHGRAKKVQASRKALNPGASSVGQNDNEFWPKAGHGGRHSGHRSLQTRSQHCC
jgi:hypothetical protein